MTTKIIAVGIAGLFLNFFLAFDASASYMGEMSGNDLNNQQGVIDVITDFDNSYDFTQPGNDLDLIQEIGNPGNASVDDVITITTDDGFSVDLKVTNTKDGKIIGGELTFSQPVDFFAIKAGNNFSVFSVDQTTSGVWKGDWDLEEDTEFRVGKNGNVPGLSHISLYSGGGGGGEPPPGGQVPEPATIFLLGSGLLGLLGFRKKFWKSKSSTKE